MHDKDTDADMMDKDRVGEFMSGYVPVPPPAMPMWIAIAYAFTHPFQLVRTSIAIAFGIVCLAVFWGFTTHAIVDAWNFAWDLWGSL